jgi:hypothetical protein
MSHPSWECSCLQPFPILKDFVRRINSTILHVRLNVFSDSNGVLCSNFWLQPGKR